MIEFEELPKYMGFTESMEFRNICEQNCNINLKNLSVVLQSTPEHEERIKKLANKYMNSLSQLCSFTKGIYKYHLDDIIHDK